MLLRKPIAAGDLIGTLYVFENAGDRLEPHAHATAEADHITIVARGRFMCLGSPRLAGRVLSADETLEFEPAELHGFEAIEPDSALSNIRKWMARR